MLYWRRATGVERSLLQLARLSSLPSVIVSLCFEIAHLLWVKHISTETGDPSRISLLTTAVAMSSSKVSSGRGRWERGWSGRGAAPSRSGLWMGRRDCVVFHLWHSRALWLDSRCYNAQYYFRYIQSDDAFAYNIWGSHVSIHAVWRPYLFKSGRSPFWSCLPTPSHAMRMHPVLQANLKNGKCCGSVQILGEPHGRIHHINWASSVKERRALCLILACSAYLPYICTFSSLVICILY